MTTQSNNHSSKQVYAGVFFLFLTIVAYLYFLNVSVVHVVMRKEAVREQNHLRTEIAMLETQYIQSQHEIAARIATLEGYNRDTAKVFVNRGEANALVLNTN